MYFCVAFYLTIDCVKRNEDLIFKTTDESPFWSKAFSPYNFKVGF